jgi:hypothetical protein
MRQSIFEERLIRQGDWTILSSSGKHKATRPPGVADDDS